MAEQLFYDQSQNKTEKYESILPQIEALIGSESDEVANMGNIVAGLKEVFDFFWVGFYQVKNDELVLAPFQGPVACTRIQSGRGVCGTAWKENQLQLVPDVEAFPGHIACSSLSRSEIVVPVVHHGKVWGVLDIDSKELNDFDEVDAHYLTLLCENFAQTLGK